MAWIYKIENLVNHLIYVGESIDYKTRWASHLTQLRGHYHNNYLLQLDFDKYEESNFKFSIIEEVADQIRFDREVYWIKTLNTLKPHGYNLTPGGEKGGNPELQKKVYVYDEEGNFLYEFLGINALARKLKCSRTAIRDICYEQQQKRVFTVSDGVLRFSFEKLPKLSPLVILNGDTSQKTYLYDEQGNFIKKCNSQREAANFLGVDYRRISDIIDNLNKTIFSPVFKQKIRCTRELKSIGRLKKYGTVSIKQINPETKQIINIFDSISFAKEYLGLKSNNNKLNEAIRDGKIYKGYYWEKA